MNKSYKTYGSNNPYDLSHTTYIPTLTQMDLYAITYAFNTSIYDLTADNLFLNDRKVTIGGDDYYVLEAGDKIKVFTSPEGVKYYLGYNGDYRDGIDFENTLGENSLNPLFNDLTIDLSGTNLTPQAALQNCPAPPIEIASLDFSGDGTAPYLQKLIAAKECQAIFGNTSNSNILSKTGSDISFVKEGATAVVDGIEYVMTEAVDSVVSAGTAMANFISKQVSDGISWFAREDSSIQLSIANWLAGNLGNLINGQMSLDAAFISLAKYVAIQEGSSALAAGISSVSGAQNVLAGILKDAGVTGTRTVNGVTTNLANDYAVSVYTALSRMAVDFALNSQGWDAGQYRAANDNCNYEIKIAA